MPIGDDALAAGFPIVPDTGEEGRVRWGAREINRTRDFIAQAPRGEMSYEDLVAVSSNFIVANGTAYDVAGLSTTVPLVNGRKYKVTLRMLINTNSSGSNRLLGQICDADNNQLSNSGYIYVPNAGHPVMALSVYRHIADETDDFTFKARVHRTVAVGAQSVWAAADNPSYIHVEDIGLG